MSLSISPYRTLSVAIHLACYLCISI